MHAPRLGHQLVNEGGTSSPITLSLPETCASVGMLDTGREILNNFIMRNIVLSSKSLILRTGGGRINCPRCLATSTRTGQQCGRPALKASNTQKCQFHGGRGSGPKTPEGRARIAEAHTVHGNETRTLRASRAQASRRLAQLEDAMHVLGLTSAGRLPGRKPTGYVALTSVEDVVRRLLNAS